MCGTKHTRLIRIVVALLLLTLIIPSNTQASEFDVAPRASYYLDSYNTYIYRSGWGKIQVWFSVTGVDYMDEIGTLTIKIYESTDNETWTWVKTHKYESSAGMLGYDKIYHSGHIEYQGTIGRYYKAYVTIWAGKDGNGDTRYMWTDVQKATLLAA